MNALLLPGNLKENIHYVSVQTKCSFANKKNIILMEFTNMYFDVMADAIIFQH